jgi:hypothetical protein
MTSGMDSMDRRTYSRLARLLVVACAALTVVAPAAQAAKTAAVAAGCAPQAFSPVFGAWGDKALYTLAPGGDFESSAGWTLSGGATVAPGSSPFARGARSLSLPAGATALSGPICVDKTYPSWRFAAQSGGGSLTIEVLYPTKTKDAGTLKPGAAWGLTRVLTFSTGQFGTGAASIRLRLSASRAPVRVDDVYIDPRLRR